MSAPSVYLHSFDAMNGKSNPFQFYSNFRYTKIFRIESERSQREIQRRVRVNQNMNDRVHKRWDRLVSIGVIFASLCSY